VIAGLCEMPGLGSVQMEDCKASMEVEVIPFDLEREGEAGTSEWRMRMLASKIAVDKE
jgi:hypothetical protein